MNSLTHNPKMLLISSFPPRECGIATFSQDLSNAIGKVFGHTLPIEVCALENDDSLNRKYEEPVIDLIYTSKTEQYRIKADIINERNDIGMVCIQHEFGLFKGVYGDALLSFMLTLNKPIVVVFHTVLPNPDEKLKKVVEAIINLSEKIIVQTNQSFKILVEDYNCNESDLEIIPHGTHIVLWKDKARLKKKYGYEHNTILSTFGLLSENKNIETVLYALPEVVQKYPEIRFLILGKTHPEIIKNVGEEYRDKLVNIVKEQKLESNVIFVNKYLALDQLLNYLNLSDIYLFSSKDPNQAVSGTFIYAKSAGCPVISTPIPHAKEIIDNGTGILLTNFDRPEEFKNALFELISNKARRTEMGKNALSKMRATSWENAAIAYGKIFGEITNKAEDLSFQLPPIKLNHINDLTTSFGMLQFSHFCKPDPDSGYTLDDNARALIATLMHYQLYHDEVSLNLAKVYLNFIEFVQTETGWFQNYVDINKNFTVQNEKVNLEDANGRAIWSLGYVLSQSEILPIDFIFQAKKCWEKAITNIDKITSPRAIAFALKGIYYHSGYNQNDELVELSETLASKLLEYYQLKSEPDWHWYEDYLTYANSTLPEAMMYAYLITKKHQFKEIAEITFDFLLSNYFMKGKIQVISNKGWFNKKNDRNFFGEQPIEIAYTIFTLELFYEVTNKSKYRNQLEVAFSWFLGNNHLNQIMYNPLNGACYDGLEENHININQGAESTVCYFMARLVMQKYAASADSNLKNKLLFLCKCEDCHETDLKKTIELH